MKSAEQFIIEERKEILPKLCLVMVMGFLFWTVLYKVFFNAPIASNLCLFSAFLSVVFYFISRRNFSKKMIHVILSTVLLNFIFSGTYGGGFGAAGMLHLIFIPFGSFILLDKKSGIVWTFLSILGIVYFSAVSYLNIPLPVNYSMAQWTFMFKMSIMSLSTITGVITLILKIDQQNKDFILQKAFQQNYDLEKKSQIGQMSGQIAHEINNPLAIINGHITTLKRRIQAIPMLYNQLQTLFEPVEANTTKIEKVVRSLKYLSRDPLEDKPIECKLMDIVQESLSICSERLTSHQIKVSINDPGIIKESLVVTKRVVVSQVLIALLDNSFDSIKDIAVKKIDIDFSMHDLEARIQIRDSGQGISESNVKKLFTPMFTTKHGDEHIGLSLSQARELMRTNKGDLKFIGNSPTTFEISFKII